MTVRRLVVRSSVAAAITLGSIVAVAPQAVAEGLCDDGSATVFLVGSEPVCQGRGTVSYGERTVSKVCSVGPVEVTAEATYLDRRKKTITDQLDLRNGTCGRFVIPGQTSATVTVH
ncbi:hypothetical protein [Nocardia iowensis]|uniref:Secreted protein n=1 Tax=Nocardia iowensis TaxID=204891 RepID=A0ABX8RQW8_NOCIO|nr:hypothetical protein [Nocardia iowensis]QXN89851.1 hypothetical protein KV110_31005 [Nocardia iowensis]